MSQIEEVIRRVAAGDAIVADVARYDVFAASEAWLAGDAERALRVLSVLEGSGDGPQLAIWALAEDLRAIAAVHSMTRSGTPQNHSKARR